MEPQHGFEETIETYSYTATPTTTRVWLERELATVYTPAGQFDGCLVMRATTTQEPMGETDEPGKWKLNRVARCGEAWCWLARGVGPVAYRRPRGAPAPRCVTDRTRRHDEEFDGAERGEWREVLYVKGDKARYR